MKKRNGMYDFECVDRIAGEVINSNCEGSFKSAIFIRKEDYGKRAEVRCYGDGLYEIVRA